MEKEDMTNAEVSTASAVEPTANGGVEEVTESVATTPGGRERIVERLRSYNPDGVYESDEDVYNGVDGMIEAMDRNNRELADVFRQNPQAASFFIDMMNGKGIYESLARNFGDDLRTVLDGEGEEAREYDAGLAEWRKREQENAAQKETFTKNSSAAMAEYEQWLQDEGYTPEEREALEQEVMDMSNAMGVGNFMGFVKALHRNRRYDSDIENARSEGEIRGRNARIAEERTLPTRGGDGLPSMQNMSRPEEREIREEKNEWSWD